MSPASKRFWARAMASPTESLRILEASANMVSVVYGGRGSPLSSLTSLSTRASSLAEGGDSSVMPYLSSTPISFLFLASRVLSTIHPSTGLWTLPAE